jgi:hypothetical protein
MSDFFGERYWPGRFWTVNYFLGGELAAGALQAALSGGATVSADLTATSVAQPGTGGGGGRVAPVWTMRLAVQWVIPVYASAAVSGQSTVVGTLTGIASAESAMQGASGFEGRGETIDRYELEAQFWLIAA